MINEKQLGYEGEVFVSNWLSKQGFAVVARNYATRYGEIDLVVEKNEVLAFVEVKTRAASYFPLSAVITLGKQNRLIKAAKYYIFKHNVIDKVCRFDVALLQQEGATFALEYLPNAFEQRQ